MKYDIIVIGAGSGGLNIAVFMNKVGLKVLLVDKADHNIGGDCLNTGCVPSKSLIHIARNIYKARLSSQFGLSTTGEIDLKKVMDEVRAKQEIIREHENAEHFRKMGIDVELGTAGFISETEISVNQKVFKSKKIVIATGSRPRMLEIPGIEKIQVLTNENIFDLQTLPKKLVVVGTGPIGIELGQAFLMLGSQVTFIGTEKRILPKEKENVATILYEKMREQGAEFVFEQEILSASDEHTLLIRDKNTKEEREIVFDNLLVAIGRKLNIESLNLEKANIQYKEGKIVTDEYLGTTNKNVFICGDVAGGYQFTHAAELHTKVLLNNFFNPFRKEKLSYERFSWVTYTTPEIATFGLNESDLQSRIINYQVLAKDFSEDDRAITDNYTKSLGEIYINPKTQTILGGTYVADNAGELVQELVLSMQAGLKIKNIFDKIYPYPTASRINKKIVLEHYKNKLTAFNKRILIFVFKYIK